jgi:hypothetical protein
MQQTTDLALNMRERAIDEHAVLRDVEPRARARRVRKWDRERSTTDVSRLDRSADEFDEGASGEKSFDRKATDKEKNRRLKQAKLRIQPLAACGALAGAGYPVASATRMRARIAARHRRDVDAVASRCFVDSCAREPSEERTSRAPRERPPIDRFDLSGRLPNEHGDGTRCRRDHRPRRLRKHFTTLARRHRRAMRIEEREERS